MAFLERVSPALEQVDSSSGAIGTAVNRAIDQLVSIIARAEVDKKTRRGWLERLSEALQADQIPYIERLGDSWGDLCATQEIASDQADAFIDITRKVLAPDRTAGAFHSGASACLSALHKAERYEDLVEIAAGEHLIWAYRRWAVKALAAQGRKAEALRLVESSRGAWSSDLEIDRLGEEILRGPRLRGERDHVRGRGGASRTPLADPGVRLRDHFGRCLGRVRCGHWSR